jgi:hypothetical protein
VGAFAADVTILSGFEFGSDGRVRRFDLDGVPVEQLVKRLRPLAGGEVQAVAVRPYWWSAEFELLVVDANDEIDWRLLTSGPVVEALGFAI